MNLKEFAEVLGGEAYGDSILAPGPGHSEEDRSLSIRFRMDGSFLVHSFVGQSFRLCRDYVREQLRLTEGTLAAGTRRKTNKHNTTRLAVRIWNSALDPIGTPAERYLNNRAIELPGELRRNTLRYKPDCPWGTITHPALIARFWSIKENKIVAIQRIALTETGNKIERRALGPTSGAVIVLDKVEGDELFVGEGLETCLAARQLGMKPVWCCASSIGIAKFPVIDKINVLHVLGEDDSSSDKAILECGERWRQAGKTVHAWFPEHGGDFNDELMERINARAL